MKLRLVVRDDDPAIERALEFARNRLYVARSLIPKEYESYFQESAHYTSAHTSTAIEGNTLGEEEAMLVLVEGPDPNQPMQVEKVNLDEAYGLMTQLATDKATRIDEGIIRTVNSIVLKGLPDSQARNRGRYRPGPSLIVDAGSREIRYRPPPSGWILELMRNLVVDIDAWMTKLPGPLAAALAHFGLISIHPFEDGNGRTARLIADTLLHLTDWSADGMISVSQIIHQQLRDYYRALREAQGENFKEEVDVTDFVKFHTDAIGAAAARLEERAVRFRRRRDSFVLNMKGVLNERQVTGLVFMIDIGKISSSRFARLTESSQATAIADLNSLVEQGLAVREGAGKNTRYRLSPDILETVKQAETTMQKIETES
jgi:Fic family protein